MRKLKRAIALLGIFGFIATVVGFVMAYTGTNYEPFQLDETVDIIGLICTAILFFALLCISFRSLAGKRSGNVLFIIACAPTIVITITYLIVIEVFFYFGIIALVALILYIVKMITKLNLLSLVATILLIAANIYFVEEFFNYYPVITAGGVTCVVGSLLSYVLSSIGGGVREKGPKVKRARKAKKSKGSSDGESKLEEAIAQAKEEAEEEKKLREWTDSNGFTYRNRP